MKPNNLLLLLLLIPFFGAAQEKPMYSSPESDEFAPRILSISEATSKAEQAGGSCAYTQAFISSSDLTKLLNISKCVGVRFYNGLQNESDKYASMIAVAVDAYGNEIGRTFSNNYLCVASVNKSSKCETSTLSKGKARNCVEFVSSSDLISQKVFFSKALLEDRMNSKNANGVSLLPAINDRSEHTISVAGASYENGKVTAAETNYYMSELPCPTDCGNTDDYLVAPK